MAAKTTIQKQINSSLPIAKKAHLGDVVYDLLNAYNTLVAAHNTLATAYNNLLAHLDTANVAGIGNANTSSYGNQATNLATVLLPEQRGT
jgi:hypothetical protein